MALAEHSVDNVDRIMRRREFWRQSFRALVYSSQGSGQMASFYEKLKAEPEKLQRIFKGIFKNNPEALAAIDQRLEHLKTELEVLRACVANPDASSSKAGGYIAMGSIKAELEALYARLDTLGWVP